MDVSSIHVKYQFPFCFDFFRAPPYYCHYDYHCHYDYRCHYYYYYYSCYYYYCYYYYYY